MGFHKSKTLVGLILLSLQVLASFSEASGGTFVQPALENRSEAWGLTTPHEQRREVLSGITDTLGAGACAFDYNRDGWIDLLLITGSGVTRPHGTSSWWQGERQSVRLYQNQRGFHFTDVTSRTLPKVQLWNIACAVEDLDGNGFADVVLSGYESAAVLFNDNGHFSTSPLQTERPSLGWTTGITIADRNGDDLLDVYFSGFIKYERSLRTNEPMTGFAPLVDPTFSVELYDATENVLLLNQGDRSLTRDPALPESLRDAQGRGLGSRLVFDPNRNEISLFLLNATGSQSLMVPWNDGGHEDTTPGPMASTGIHYLASNEMEGMSSRSVVATTPRGEPIKFSRSINTPFDDLDAWDTGVTNSKDIGSDLWDVTWADVNVDGRPDIVLARGATTPQPDASYLPQGQSNVMRVAERGGFRDYTIGSPLSSSRTALRADFNNDGRIDLLFTNNNRAPDLFINTTSPTGAWIGVQILDASGLDITRRTDVTLTLVDGTEKKLSRFRDQTLFGQHDPRALFRINKSARAASIRVTWPGGETKEYASLKAGKYNVISNTSYAEPSNASIDTKSNDIKGHAARLGSLYTHLKLQRVEQLSSDERRYLLDAARDGHGISPRMLEYFPVTRDESLLPFLVIALKSSDSGTVTSALDVADRWEFERTVDPVHALLGDDRPTIVCRATQILRRWFAEEEAVTQGKYLAVPRLVELVDSPIRKVRVCALLALAEVESYRGTRAIERAALSSDEFVATVAVYALGMRRQSTSLGTLTTLTSNAPEGGPFDVAIRDALFRIDATESAARGLKAPRDLTPLHELLSKEFASPIQEAPALDKHSQGTRDDPGLSQPLAALLFGTDYSDTQLLDALANPNTQPGELVHALSGVPEMHQARALSLVNALLRHPDASVAESAIKAARTVLPNEQLQRRLWRILKSPQVPAETRACVAWSLGTAEPDEVLKYLLTSGLSFREL